MFKAISTLLQSIFSRSSSALNSESSSESKLYIQKQALESNKADSERLLAVLEDERKKVELEILNLKNQVEYSKEDVRQAKLQERVARADLENTKSELRAVQEELNKTQTLLSKSKSLNNSIITSLENTKNTLDEIKTQEPEIDPFISEASEALKVSRRLTKEEISANILKAKEDAILRKRLSALKAKDQSPERTPEAKNSPKKTILQ